MKLSPPSSLVRSAIREAAIAHGVRPEDIMSSARRRPVVMARHAAIRAIWRAGEDRYSICAIGRALDLDHSSVCYALTPVREVPHA